MVELEKEVEEKGELENKKEPLKNYHYNRRSLLKGVVQGGDGRGYQSIHDSLRSYLYYGVFV